MPRKAAKIAEIIPLKEAKTLPGPYIGNAATLGFLLKSADKERLAHAYLFVGPDRVGKMPAALTLAQRVLGVENPLAHADFSIVEREHDAKTGKLHGSIVIAQAQELIRRLSLRSFLGGYTVCILDGADALTTEAANALLKTIEEPRLKTLLLLLATSESDVLPTIRSRCQVMRFPRVATSDIRAGLVERGVVQEKADLYARLAGGLPGKAIDFSAEPESLKKMFALRETLLDFPDRAVAERWQALEKVIPSKLPFQEAVDAARSVTDLAAELLRDALLVSAGQGDAITHIDSKARLTAWASASGAARIAAAAEQVEETRRLLDSNVNPRTALDRLALSF